MKVIILLLTSLKLFIHTKNGDKAKLLCSLCSENKKFLFYVVNEIEQKKCFASYLAPSKFECGSILSNKSLLYSQIWNVPCVVENQENKESILVVGQFSFAYDTTDLEHGASTSMVPGYTINCVVKNENNKNYFQILSDAFEKSGSNVFFRNKCVLIWISAIVIGTTALILAFVKIWKDRSPTLDDNVIDTTYYEKL